MFESLETGLQLLILLVCMYISIWRALATRAREWILLAFFYGSWVLGDLYWEACLIFYGKTPHFFYVSDLNWWASYIFLFLLLKQAFPPEAWQRRRILPWLGVVFTVGMGVFYLQWGDLFSNAVCAVLMGLLLFYAVWGLMYLRQSGSARQRPLCLAVLLFCAAEYCTWTASCFWRADSAASLYLWADTLLSFSFFAFLPAARKAVEA